MQTRLIPSFRDTPAGREAERILRSCVHCGFCSATCPTYQLLGDELDSPRGRIYQIKRVLEGEPPSRRTQIHLDRCLTCRSCETTCPSGVHYGELLEVGRRQVEEAVKRPLKERIERRLALTLLPYPRRFAALLRVGRAFRPLLPKRLADKIPPTMPVPPPAPAPQTKRHMLLLEGCVQPALDPGINGATRNVLARLGIHLDSAAQAGCCGAMPQHLSNEAQALTMMRRNIDAWWPAIEAGAEAIVISASACAVTVKEYGRLLRDDSHYRDRAARVSAMTRDLVEVLEQEPLGVLGHAPSGHPRVAFHAPCTLQHGEQLPGRVEVLLGRLGFQLTPVPDAHLCCGASGTYSLFQPEIAVRLRENKLAALQSGGPGLIASANIGCLNDLRAVSPLPVVHWIQLLESLTAPAASAATD
ncbi:MAG TPA: glycolate oxidase subunit GlcF [Chromatiales bacterium]|nr:glycolate oxidase subunit GlcF [Chromatiales bacterium]